VIYLSLLLQSNLVAVEEALFYSISDSDQFLSFSDILHDIHRSETAPAA
jgi:hypothetical protein